MHARDAALSRLAPSCLWGGALLCLAAAACRPGGPEALEVLGTDYGFTVTPRVTAGSASVGFMNQGKVPHEMALGRLKVGMTADSAMARLAQGLDPSEVTDGVVGILIAEPGQRSIGTLQTELIHGRTYLMICQFRDADSLPPHVAMGMHASFTVD